MNKEREREKDREREKKTEREKVTRHTWRQEDKKKERREGLRGKGRGKR